VLGDGDFSQNDRTYFNRLGQKNYGIIHNSQLHEKGSDKSIVMFYET
jgi:hypothetical protein